jgi:hypothetical protein
MDKYIYIMNKYIYIIDKYITICYVVRWLVTEIPKNYTASLLELIKVTLRGLLDPEDGDTIILRNLGTTDLKVQGLIPRGLVPQLGCEKLK